MPGNHELRAPRAGGRIPHDHGHGRVVRHQPLRHGQRLRAPPRGRRDRGDHRALVREGQRPARQGRVGDEGLRADGRLAQRGPPVQARDHPPMRGVARAAPDGPDRSLPDAPHRPERLVGRDLGSHGPPQAPGEDPVRRILQLRGVAHREGERDRRLSWIAPVGHRAVGLQPQRAIARARGDPGGARVRDGVRSATAPSGAVCSRGRSRR